MVLASPKVSTVTHDVQKPRPGIVPAKALDVAEGMQARVLNNVLRIHGTLSEPHCQRIGIVEMRHYDLLNTRLVINPVLAPGTGSFRWCSAGCLQLVLIATDYGMIHW